MKRKLAKKLLSSMLVVSMCFTQIPLGNLSAVEEVYAEGTNLLDNGDFEKNEMTSWNFTVENSDENVTATIVNWGGKSEPNALKINNLWKDSSSTNRQINLTQHIDQIPKGEYKFSFSMAGAVKDGYTVSDSFAVIKKGEVSSEWTTNESTAWNDYKTYTFDISVSEDVNKFETKR